MPIKGRNDGVIAESDARWRAEPIAPRHEAEEK